MADSFARRAGTKLARLIARAGDPGAVAGQVTLYSKLVNSVAQMFVQAGDGTTYQISNAPMPAPQVLNGIITPAQLGTSQNNYNPAGLSTATLIRQDISTTISITGLVAQPANTLVAIRNIKPGGGMEYITIPHESGSSTAANRFNLPGRGDWYIPPGGTMIFLYDSAITRWVVWSFATNSFPGLDGDGQPGLTVGVPNEHLGLARQASLVLGLNAAGSKRVRVSGASADPNPFSYQSDTYFNALGQFRWASTQAVGPIGGSTDNLAVNASTITARISTSAAADLLGIATGTTGRVLTLVNIGADNITLQSNASSTPANGFLLPAASYVLPPEGVIQIWYDTTSSRWRALSKIT